MPQPMPLDRPAPDAAPEARFPVSRIAATLRVVALAAAALFVVWLLPTVVLLVFFAVLLGATLRGTADWLAGRTGLRASWMLALVCLVLVAVSVGFAMSIGPSLADQASQLFGTLSGEIRSLQDRYGRTEWGQRILHHLQPSSGGGSDVGEIAAPVVKVLGATLDFFASLVLLVITALYMAISPRLYMNGVLKLLPVRHRARGGEVMHETGRTLRRWLLGQVIDMLVVAVLTGLGLFLLGVPVPLALGALAGLLTFIPYFGAVLAGLPAVLVALTVSPHLALLTLGVFLVVHLIEGYVISPLIQKRMVDIPPALTVMSMTAAGTLFGPLGIILGTPLAAAGMVLVREIYVADVLGDRSAQPDH